MSLIVTNHNVTTQLRSVAINNHPCCYKIARTDKHVAVGVVGDREEMGRHFGSAFTAVFADDVRCVNWQATIRVDDDAKQTRVCLKTDNTALSFSLSLSVRSKEFVISEQTQATWYIDVDLA